MGLVLFWIDVDSFFCFYDWPANYAAGAYRFGDLPALSRYAIIPGIVLFIATFAFFIGAVLVGMFLKGALLKNGQKATATILRLYETGTTVNHSPVVEFELEVNPSTGASFNATTEQLISCFRIHEYEIGKQIEVRYDLETKL